MGYVEGLNTQHRERARYDCTGESEISKCHRDRIGFAADQAAFADRTGATLFYQL